MIYADFNHADFAAAPVVPGWSAAREMRFFNGDLVFYQSVPICVGFSVWHTIVGLPIVGCWHAFGMGFGTGFGAPTRTNYRTYQL